MAKVMASFLRWRELGRANSFAQKCLSRSHSVINIT